MRHNKTQTAIARPRHLTSWISALAIGVMILAIASEAQALRLSMKRITFEGPKRSETLTLLNNTNNEQIYRLQWRHYVMNDSGGLDPVPEGEGETAEFTRWADDLVRFAPRRVTIPPGGSQQVRMFARRKSDMEEGEYRTHLWIKTESKPEAFRGDNQENEPDEGDSQVRIGIQPSISLPVFVRQGDLKADVSITKASAEKVRDNLARVDLSFERSGDRSVYGDIEVICTADGDEYVARQLRGVAIYTEVEKLDRSIGVEIPEEHSDKCREMKIDYRSASEDPQFEGDIMASAKVTL